jgi:hypothetical protein
MSDVSAQEAVETEASETETTQAEAETPEAESQEAKANGEAQDESTANEPADSYTRFVESIKDEKARDYASRFKTPEDMAKAALDMRRAQSNMIPKLGKNPSEEQVEAYRKAIGAGQSLDDYDVPIPEGVDLSETDEALLNEFKQIALDNSLPIEAANNAASAFFKKNDELIKGFQKELDEAAEQEVTELRSEWGKDFEPNVQAGIEAGQRLIGEDMQKLADMPVTTPQGLKVKLGNLATFNKLMATMGKRMGEDGVIGYQTKEERQSIEQQIEEIRANNPFPYDKKTQAKLEKLYAQLYPDQQG